MDNIMSVKQFNGVLSNEPILLAYFGKENCSVCHATKPKVDDLIKRFPGISACYCPADHLPELAGQFLIFTVPAVLIFHMGSEQFRSARFIDLVKAEELLKELSENNGNTVKPSK